MSNLLWFAGFAAAHVLLVWLVAIRRAGQARRQMPEPIHPPDTWPSVSVLVPAWQERDTIERCVAALKTVDYPQDWEALVIAGGPDGTHELAQELCVRDERLRVLEQRPRGKNAALSEGLRVARGQVIALLDADSQVEPGWLRALVGPIAAGRGTLLSTGSFFPQRETPVSLGEQMERIAALEIQRDIRLQGAAGIAVQRDVIESLGGFPEDVRVGVDWDLDARLAEKGIRPAFCPEALVLTPRPATLGEYWRNEVRWRRAHFASLFRLSDHFLKGPVPALINLYIYGLAWFTLGLTCFVFVAALAWPAGIGRSAVVLWSVFLGWLLLRRAALTAEVAAYKQDWRWLKLIWVPPLLLSVTLAACIPATLTWRRQQVHFKGPRPRSYADDSA